MKVNIWTLSRAGEPNHYISTNYKDIVAELQAYMEENPQNGDNYNVKFAEMDEEDYNNLPEFDGF